MRCDSLKKVKIEHVKCHTSTFCMKIFGVVEKENLEVRFNEIKRYESLNWLVFELQRRISGDFKIWNFFRPSACMVGIHLVI